ncbi:hypothetical protein KCU61_g6330, partial [Aureobasidium melanogenum]
MPRGATPSFRHGAEASPPISPTFAPHQTPSWLKRFSFSSRDSTQSSTSRPDSSVISVAPSASGSTTPMIPSHTPPINTAPNKLVKRSTSVSKVPTSASYGGSTTKIPVPTLRRPATSHKRSATLQERRTPVVPKAEEAFRHSFYDSPAESMPKDVQWRNYFAPRQAVVPPESTRRRNSTSIPNPIKKVYADRKYRPVLVSARENIKAAPIEFDDDADDLEAVSDSNVVSNVPVADRFYSSSQQTPLASNRLSRATVDFQSTSFDSRIDERKSIEDELDRQDIAEMSGIESASSSFSVSDILPAEPQIWKQPPPIKAAPVAKYRRPGARARSNTPTSMGNRQSLSHDEPSDAVARQRDLDGLTQTTKPPSVSSPITEIDLRLPSHQTQSALGAPLNHADPSNLQSDDSEYFDTLPSPPRPIHHAAYHADSASLLAGSDTEMRLDEDETLDSQGDTIYDSVRTRAPKSSPGRRGPSIETIFGDSPPFHIHGKHTMLRDYLQTGPLHDQGYSLKPRHSIIHEEDAISTPARSARQQSLGNSPMLRMKQSLARTNVPSSPPTMPSLSDLRQHAEHFPDVTDADADDDEESSWSFADDDDDEPQVPYKNRFAHLGITPDLLSPHGHASSSANTTPQRPTIRSTDRDTRSSIFDWSEQQPIEKSPNNRSPPRPKTVHGKKDAETRGSRSVGRRAPSGLHVRSQSVPVAQEGDGKRTGTNKFGTWGIGSKGVTEDWNEDFDFEDENAPEEKRLDSGVSMFVPKSIRDQQTNVLANIGLLRDWGLLIEELKELKMRAVMLEVLDGDNEKMWSEVDAMIDLADQESDEQTLAPRFSPSSSPSFNYDAFDDPLPATEHLMPPPLFGLPESPADGEFDFYSEEATVSPSRTDNGIFITPATPGRPRKNSEAVARSVIEALQQKRLSNAGLNPERRDKVHFDTATLKRIIPYVQELRDRVKKVIRDAEDLLPSPKSLGGSIGSHGSRSVRRRKREVPESPTIHRRSRRSTSAIERTSSDDGLATPTEELNARLRLMAMT